MFSGYVDAATSEVATLRAWAAQYPTCNWSVIPKGSGIWALDVDVPSPDHAADGVAALRRLCARYGTIPKCPHGRSGGGGHLLIFRDAGHPIVTRTGTPMPGIDPRAGRVAFTVSPSIHRRGGTYKWLVAPWDHEPPVAPEWLLRQLAPREKTFMVRSTVLTADRALHTLSRAVNCVQDAQPGQRNATLNRQAFTVGGLVGAGAIEESFAVAALYQAGRYAGLDDPEVRATIQSGIAAGRKLPFDGRSRG